MLSAAPNGDKLALFSHWTDKILNVICSPLPVPVVTLKSILSVADIESVFVVSSSRPVTPEPMETVWFPFNVFFRIVTVVVLVLAFAEMYT